MKKLKTFIEKKEYIKFFLMFFSGTLFAQFISILISPVLTRLYTPSDFGLFGTYLALVSILIVFVTGRYEFAINSSDSKDDAISIYRIVNYLTIFMSGTIFVILLFFGSHITNLLNLNFDRVTLYLIPITLLFMGLLQSSTYLLNREKDFEVLSKSKIYQSTGNATLTTALGYYNIGFAGLIIGNFAGYFVSQYYQRKKSNSILKFKIDRKRLLSNFVKYKHFPLYNAPSALFDNLAIQAPVFILLRFFSESVVGFYSLTLRVIGSPLSLISTSISQVFLSQVSELHRNNQPYRHIIIKVAKYLALIGILPILMLVFYGPVLFSFAFGNEWGIAGEYAQILSIGYYFKFIVSPLAIVFFINQNIKVLSVIQITRAFSTFFTLITSSYLFELKTVLMIFTIHETIFYSVYFYFIVKTSK